MYENRLSKNYKYSILNAIRTPTEENRRCTVDSDAIEVLKSYEWTGNIRELRNVTERLVIMCGNKISAEDVQKYS